MFRDLHVQHGTHFGVVDDIFRVSFVIISKVRVLLDTSAMAFQHENRLGHEELSRGDTPRRSGVIANLCQVDIFWKIFELFIALWRQVSLKASEFPKLNSW